MPINGGTRMLRARRKDINVKPNRRLDRKSSRGMLFENEELRMRTITINAEVEQGQHALKKLRRENEQLRREMWSLRDEYDKMEKLLRKKDDDDDDDDGEDSDQENSDSDDNYSQTEDTDEEKKEGSWEENRSSDAAPSRGKFPGNLATARAFDGLSVIDEQTEETTTQTTESAFGCGTSSRGNSANRTFGPAAARLYEDQATNPFYEYHPKASRRKVFHAFENEQGFAGYGTVDWPDNGYDVRPASPYPYPESLQPSYQKRFQVLQNLPPMLASRVDENGWVFPNAAKASYGLFPSEPGLFAGSSFLPDKSVTGPISIDIPQEVQYGVVHDRTGPDVFVSDACAKKNAIASTEEDAAFAAVHAEVEKSDVNAAPEENANNGVREDESRKGVAGAKLTTAKRVDEDDGEERGPVEDSVAGQNPNRKDIRSQFDTDDMARVDKASKFQSKLTVTLKTPAGKPDFRTLKRVPPVQVPRSYRTLDYGAKQELQNKPYVGFPECRYAVPQCRPDGDAEADATFSPPALLPAGKADGVALDSEHIPVQRVPDGFGLLAEAGVPGVGVGVPAAKPIKIPPVPPPRTTSCLGAVIPESPIGITAVHHRTFRRARSPTACRAEPGEAFVRNPLMLSEPMATSSPAISPRMSQRERNLSLDNLHRRPLGSAAYDESSAEDVSARRTRGAPPHLNKSVSSPSFGTFLRRKPSEHSVSSLENGTTPSGQADRKISRGNPQNNASVSSSSGLDSPTKSDRRKRRVSIKFNKKAVSADGAERICDSRQEIAKHRGKMKSRHEETDATTSERERTNSVSSRASSSAGRRKPSLSGSRAYVSDDKIPWCGCWGNGCV